MGQALVWLLILGVTAVLVVAVAIPRVAGATPYTILTGSMQPDLPPGTLVVVRPVEAGEIGLGDVVTYQLESGKPAVVTHRVVAHSFTTAGETRYQTQGDANNTPDQHWVTPVQVQGKKWYAIPYLGYVSNVLTGKERQMAIYLVAALLLGYAAFTWTGATRDWVRRRRAAA